MLSPAVKPSGQTGLITSVTQERNHSWGGFCTSRERSHLLTTGANMLRLLEVVSEKFQGDVFMLSSWSNV